ncbi:hypothetical protein ET532_025420, partial [Verminephrobacter sp. Larva24]
GVFCHSPESGCPATLPDGRATGVGAIKTFDAMALYGRRTRGYQSNTAWLNPLGEMLAQTLQYYAYNGTTPVPSNPAVRSAGAAWRAGTESASGSGAESAVAAFHLCRGVPMTGTIRSPRHRPQRPPPCP